VRVEVRNVHVVVIQPYIPAYRVEFFGQLASRLAEQGSSLTVVHGRPQGHQAKRRDEAEGRPWSREVAQFEVGWGRVRLRYKHVWRYIASADAVVTELASTSIDSLWLALRRDPRWVVWGHGRSYVTKGLALDDRVEGWLAKRARRVLVYTDGGASGLVGKGIPLSRVTVLRNSNDSVELRKAMALVTDADIERMRTELDLPQGPIALFVGGLDSSKRIEFLLEAASHAGDIATGFALVIAGTGQDAPLVAKAVGVGEHVRWIRRVGPQELAILGEIVTSIWMPGRVGLVAVDALALGLPVLSTDFPHHAPEAEYIESAGLLKRLTNEPMSFAREALHFMASPIEGASRRGSLRDPALPSIEEMVDHFMVALAT
jgi:glycosyltransferase involved in cell wall biosynthesis